MTTLERYTPVGSGVAKSDPFGLYVYYTDVAFLEAELFACEAVSNAREKALAKLQFENDLLKSEHARLITNLGAALLDVEMLKLSAFTNDSSLFQTKIKLKSN